MADRVDRTERLLNLVIALMGTSRALPRQGIREHVPGYGEAASEAPPPPPTCAQRFPVSGCR